MSKRLLYSVLKRINEKDIHSPKGQDYKINDGEFREYIFKIKYMGFIVGEIMTFDKCSLKFASVTEKGMDFLNEHVYLDKEHPRFRELPNWVRKDVPK